jgi:CYTH domain-containing protein/predicted ATPase
MPDLKRVVMTGGPCAGKTTALARVSEWFESHGWTVIRVPEAATLMILGGARPDVAVNGFDFQTALLKVQMSLEDSFLSVADGALKRGQNVLVLCDRGTMDSAAYVSDKEWRAIVDGSRGTLPILRDSRYDAVIHLVTAADGAAEFYTLSNNEARKESAELAIKLDHLTRDAWVGHPHLRVIGNGPGGFEAKIRDVIQAICRVVGIPEPVESERKFLVRRVDDKFPVKTVDIEIEQTYLDAADTWSEEERVRRRGQGGEAVYYHTIKRPLRAGQRIEVERQITPREYVELLARAHSMLSSIRKTRTCFVWKDTCFELDRFREPHEGLMLLEAEVEPGTVLDMPYFIHIEREVTDDAAWSNRKLAQNWLPEKKECP